MADIVTIELGDTVTYPDASGFTIEVVAGPSLGPEATPDPDFVNGGGVGTNQWANGGGATIPVGGPANILSINDVGTSHIRFLAADDGADMAPDKLYELDLTIASIPVGTVDFYWNDANLLGAFAANGSYELTTAGLSGFTSVNVYYTAPSGQGHTVDISRISIREKLPGGIKNTFTIGLIDPPTGGSNIIQFTSDVAGWTPPLVLGDVPTVAYDSVGNNLADSDGKRLKSQTFTATNCTRVAVITGWAGNRDCV